MQGRQGKKISKKFKSETFSKPPSVQIISPPPWVWPAKQSDWISSPFHHYSTLWSSSFQTSSTQHHRRRWSTSYNFLNYCLHLGEYRSPKKPIRPNNGGHQKASERIHGSTNTNVQLIRRLLLTGPQPGAAIETLWAESTWLGIQLSKHRICPQQLL